MMDAGYHDPMIIVQTDYVEPNLDWEADQYARAGVDYRRHQLRLASPEALIDAAKDADVLVVDQSRITREVIAGLDRCRLIIRHGDGYDNLDVQAATEAGIVCANEPGFWSREAAEQAFVLALILALRIPQQQEVARHPRTGENAGWNLGEAMPYGSLGSLTVGLVGCGKIGRHALSLFLPVAGAVLVSDPFVRDFEIEGLGARSAPLDILVAESDIISLHVPATEETVGLFDAAMLARMKKGALLVNAARGSLVDTDALAAALESGQLGGAALDSTDPEPLPADHPLFGMTNVIVTPHMGWYSEDALSAIRRRIVEDALGALDGRIPESVVNPEVLKQPKLRIGRS